MSHKNDECLTTRRILDAFYKSEKDSSILSLAMDGCIELDEHVFQDVAVKQAIEHLLCCQDCQAWRIASLEPDLFKWRTERKARCKKYCCTSMFMAVTDERVDLNVRFELFRGEDPCWMIGGYYAFAHYCPWCGSTLPDRPFEDSPDAFVTID